MDLNLQTELKPYLTNETVIVCIGTDKSIGDCLGPLVGTILVEKEFNIPVYGTLDKPIHALNIHERLDEIYSRHPNATIIGVDACLGDEYEIGEIRVRDYAISPGKGVGKKLPEVGVASIIGIVADSDRSDMLFYPNTIRLSFIMNMAKNISKIFINAYKERMDTNE